MESLEILLKQRTSKAILYFFVECFFLPTTIAIILFTIGSFSWLKVILGIIFLFGTLYAGKGLFEFIFYNNVRLVVESDGKTISFYNTNSGGTIFNKSEPVDLTIMGKFYIVKKRTRYLMNNYSFAFEEIGSSTSLFKKEVETFPSLFEATETDRNKVLLFVKTVYPEIDLGYENMWQKLSKNK